MVMESLKDMKKLNCPGVWELSSSAVSLKPGVTREQKVLYDTNFSENQSSPKKYFNYSDKNHIDLKKKFPNIHGLSSMTVCCFYLA